MIPRLDAFASRLRSAREELDLDQTQFGLLGGVSRGAQSNYEKGARAPDVAYLLKLAHLGIDVGYLVSGERPVTTLPTDIAHMVKIIELMPERTRSSLLKLLEAMASDMDAIPQAAISPPSGFRPLRPSLLAYIERLKAGEEDGSAGYVVIHDSQDDYRGE